MKDGVWIDNWIPCDPQEAVDLGWGVAVIDVDAGTVTRTCRGCHVSVTGPFRMLHGIVLQVESRPFGHRPGCPIFGRFGNNATQS